MWVYNPRVSPPEGNKLDNKKLSISLAGPYLFEGMAKIGKVYESGQVVRRFLVHGSKVRLCQMGGEPSDDQRQRSMRLGMLPDFLDSEVSGPLYRWKEWQREDPAEQKVSVQPRMKSPLGEVPD